MTKRRIAFTTLGSLGDLHPYMALAIGLRGRGHDCVIATSEVYREKIERAGLEFAPVRPDLEDFGDEATFMAKVMHPMHGSSFVIREIAMKWIRESYADLMNVAKDADLIVGHPLTFALPLVAEKTGVRWIGTGLQPMVFFSAYDPPVFGPLQWLRKLPLGPGFYRWIIKKMKGRVRSWAKPLDQLRQSEGLPPDPHHPLLESIYSDRCNLALFSRSLAEPQVDWPQNTIVTGFAFHDVGLESHHHQLSTGLEAFLQAGPPPVVFTLGSSAVLTAGNFYRESYLAAKRAGFRAVLLIGRDERNRFTEATPPNVFIDDYAPYSQLFGRSAAVFHQGGVGTTGQAMRAGVPMVIMPFSHDQPDHALRIERMGCGFGISRRGYRASRVIELVQKLSDPKVIANAKRVGESIRNEDGVSNACDVIEAILEEGPLPTFPADGK